MAPMRPPCPLTRLNRRQWLVGAAALGLVPGGLQAQATPRSQRVVGVAQELGNGRFLYTEVHEQVLASDGAVVTAVTTYHAADGREFARKTLDYRQNRSVPAFRLDQPLHRYSEGLRLMGDQAEVFKVDQGKEKRSQIQLGGGPVAADSGFNQLLIDAMPRLRQGETVNFRLIVAGQTDQFRFRAKAIGEGRVEDEPALRLKVEPDSMLRWLVDPLELAYGLQPARLLDYRGVSNIINPDTGEVYRKVRVHYPRELPPEARAALKAKG